MTYYTFANTLAGTVLLTSDDTTVTGMFWKVFKRTPQVDKDWVENAAPFRHALRQLDEYFAGKRRAFDLPYKLHGTDFQMSVWRELAKIPYGTSSNYQAIARAIGKPKAARAVGTAVGSNPLSIFVPCHRVLTSQGALGGYAGGLECKRLLLQIENIPYK